MAHAETCPICGGGGWYPPTFRTFQNTCYGCDGKGWVEVAQKEIEEFGRKLLESINNKGAKSV